MMWTTGLLLAALVGFDAPRPDVRANTFEIEAKVRDVNSAEIDGNSIKIHVDLLGIRSRTDGARGRPTDLTEVARTTGTLGFKGTDEELQVYRAALERVIQEDVGMNLRGQCDQLSLGHGPAATGEGQPVMVRFEGNRRWLQATATFTRVDIFQEVCGT